MINKRHFAGAALVAAVAISLTACASTAGSSLSGSSSAVDAKTATSAADFGGMKALEAAADAEGQLNVIALPHSWANYGKIIDAFKKKYPKITINEANPDGSSADEISAAKAQNGQSTAPDVFDLGTAVLQQNLDMLAPYKVANWADLPAEDKDAAGKWYYDYTGLMSIGYDSSVIKTAPKKLDDLLGSAYKSKVSIKGDPTQANEAASAVYLAALQSKGSPSDVQPGIDFFQKLNAAGNYNPTLPTQATVASGETPVVIQWSYNNLAWGAAGGAAGNANYKTVVLPGVALGSYYNQGVNVNAPHPAAARLWEEFVYSPQAQNLFLAAGAYPATLQAMIKDKTVDESTLKTVGEPPKNLQQLTADQATTAATLLASKWAAAIG